MIRVRHGAYGAETGPPDGYGTTTVRLTSGGQVGQVIGTVNYDEDHRLWLALRPEDDGHSEGAYESTPTEAVRWLLREFAGFGVSRTTRPA